MNYIVWRYYVVALLALVSISTMRGDSWRILFYMDSIEDLNDMATKGITDMMSARPADSVEFFIQLPAYKNAGLRYQVTHEKLVFKQECELSGDSRQDMIDAAAWGFADSGADHMMLILSNHGWGILDEDLVASLRIIKETVLQGQELDILAFDTCMGAMIEVAYQVAPYAHYLVGSQSCSLKDGFDYKGVSAVLNQENNGVVDVATGMVRAFDAYYSAHDDSGVYTHVALDLSCVEPVIQALNSLASLVLALPDRATLLGSARDQSPRCCMWPMYTDLVAFCNLIEHNLRTCDTQDISRILYGALYEAVSKVRAAVDAMAISRCAGFAAQKYAHGCAVYCPPQHIDSSYYSTLFAQNCKWLLLLQAMSGDTEVHDTEHCVHAISF